MYGDVEANVEAAVDLVERGHAAGSPRGGAPRAVPDRLRRGALVAPAAASTTLATTGWLRSPARRRRPAPWSSPVPRWAHRARRRSRCSPSTRPAASPRSTTSSTSPTTRSRSSPPARAAPPSWWTAGRWGSGVCFDGCFPQHAAAAAADGASAYLCPSAYYAGSEHRRDLYYAARALDNGIYVVFAGLTGRCGSRDFNGGSAVYDPEGRPLARVGAEHPAIAVAGLDAAEIDRVRAMNPILPGGGTSASGPGECPGVTRRRAPDTASSPRARDDACGRWARRAEPHELDVLVVGGGVVGAGTALDAVTRGLSHRAGRAARPAPAAPAAAAASWSTAACATWRCSTSGWSARRCRSAACCSPGWRRTWSGRCRSSTRCTHRGWERPYVGAGLLLYDAHGDGRASTTWACPGTGTCSAARSRRMAPDLRTDELTGAIRYYDCQVDDARLVHDHRPHRRGVRRPRRHAHQGDRLPARGRAGRRRPRASTSRTAASSRSAPGSWSTPPASGPTRSRRWSAAAARSRPGQQGHPPRRARATGSAPRPASSPDREVGAVRDPVGPALDHRHHRHPVGPRQGAPGGVARRHRLPARPRQHDAARAARPRGRRGRVRRAAAAARPGSPSRPRGSPASTPSSPRCPAW